MKATNQSVQRSFNRSLVLHQFRQGGGISRVALSRMLGLKKSSITAIVGELLETGLVREGDSSNSKAAVGRKPVTIELNAEFCCFLGIEVQPTRFQVAILDLGGRVLHRETGNFGGETITFEEKLNHIFRKMEPVILAGGIPLAGLGIGIPGLVDPWSGIVNLSVPHSLKNWDVNRFPNPWGVPTTVENDANCCAWATLLDGDPTNGGDFLVLLLEFQDRNPEINQEAGVSLGIGVVLGGEVHYGRNFEAGEYRSLQWRSGHKSQTGIPDLDLERITTDPEVMDRYLVEILLNLIPVGSVLDPERIILCGEAGPAYQRIPFLLEGPLAGTWWDQSDLAQRLTQSKFGSEEVAVGAAARFLMTLFSFNRRSIDKPSEGSRPPLDWDYLFSRFGRTLT